MLIACSPIKLIDKVVLELQQKAARALKSLKSVKEEQRFNFLPYIKDI